MKSAFIINLSKGDKVKIDEDEMPKFIDGVKKGNIIIFRQGVVNPSFVISITRDTDRMRAYFEDFRSYEYISKEYPDRKYSEPEIKPLYDIFEELRKNNLLINDQPRIQKQIGTNTEK